MSKGSLTVSYIKELMESRGLRAKKAFGQNFLVNEDVAQAIAWAVNPCQDDFVIEIGPGLGALTVFLVEKAGNVAAIELDGDFVPVLKERFLNQANVEVIQADFLKIDLEKLVSEKGSGFTNLKIVGSLPYYITSPILERIFESQISPKRISIMIQKEAAERIISLPGSQGYGVMSLQAAMYGSVKIIKTVSPDAFFPQPGVDSSVVLINPEEAPVLTTERAFLLKIIKAAFRMRRKTLLNCLITLGYSREYVSAAINGCGLPENVRGERLSLNDFDKLCQSLL